MDHGRIQALHSTLRRAMDATKRALGAQTRGVQYKHQLDYHHHQIAYARETLDEANSQLLEIKEELPDQVEEKLKPGEATKVRSHVRKLKKKAVGNDKEKTPSEGTPSGSEALPVTEEKDEEENEGQTRLDPPASSLASGFFGSSK